MVVQHAGPFARFLKGLVEEGGAPAVIGMILGGAAGLIFQPVGEGGAIGNAFLFLFWGGVIGWGIKKAEDKAKAAREMEAAAREAKAKKPDQPRS